MKITKLQLKEIIKEELEAVIEATATHDDYGREKFTYGDPGGMDYQVSFYGDTALKKMRSNLERANWSEEQIERFSKLRFNNFMMLRPDISTGQPTLR